VQGGVGHSVSVGGPIKPEVYSDEVTDWSRFLPLSNRARGDEELVGRSWSEPAAALLQTIAAVLDARPDLLTAPTLRPELTVESAVRELLAELGSPWWRRWALGIGATESLRPEIASITTDALASVLRQRAVERAASSVRTNIRDLGAVVVLALDLRVSCAVATEVDPFLCGTVALDLALRARQPQRSVVTARTFVAVDGGWQVGRGPQLQASAASIVLFLAGRSDVPSEAPTSAS